MWKLEQPKSLSPSLIQQLIIKVVGLGFKRNNPNTVVIKKSTHLALRLGQLGSNLLSPFHTPPCPFYIPSYGQITYLMSQFCLNFKRTMISFLWLILLTHIRWVNTADLANVSTSQVLNIFILAGQSNMSGRGGVINHGQNGLANETWDGVIPPECQSNSNILRLNAGLTWVEAQEPLHQDIDLGKVCGVGPGMSFANSVLKRDPSIGVIGLVPCAIGGTNISEWARGGVLYNHMIRRTEAALQGGGQLQALLWYQGESDTETLEDAKLYRFRLKRLFKNVLRDLQSPTLPVIQVALASSIGSYMEQVRKAQLSIDLPNVRTVDAKGLPVGMDYVHITTLAQVQLGQMLADTFLQTHQTTQAVLLPVQTGTVTSNAPRRCSNFVLDLLLSPFR
ncbi:hypothetical protein RDI58_011524 [Solanum bulbocastanum]|uniref:Sialate O-acetylesterase domain-containing protein n=1 Tax=Solanum bulbocastanum TaxID=147425 RepID=A0AAN8TXH6_SOLBU